MKNDAVRSWGPYFLRTRKCIFMFNINRLGDKSVLEPKFWLGQFPQNIGETRGTYA